MEDLAAPAPASVGFTYTVATSQTLGLAVILVVGAWMGVYRGGFAWESPELQFNVHPLCMIVGMVFLQGDGQKRFISAKMAPTTPGAEKQKGPVTTADLAAALVENQETMLDSISNMLKPMYEQLEIMQENIQETREIAETALNNSVLNQNTIQDIHQSVDVLVERALKMDLSMRQNNIKIRGMAENVEDPGNLPTFLSQWLSHEIKLEGDVLPVITKAYRLGFLKALKTRASRDILLTVLDLRFKQLILQSARQCGHHMYNGERIEIYQDLPPEALEK